MTDADFDALYQARYGDVVAMAYALTGDLAEAQDLAQEAFCRAWQRWSTLAGFDDPLAWIRRVTANLAASRWASSTPGESACCAGPDRAGAARYARARRATAGGR